MTWGLRKTVLGDVPSRTDDEQRTADNG
jgi:hypothetical protein